MKYQIRFHAADQKWYAEIVESDGYGYATKNEAEEVLARIRSQQGEVLDVTSFAHCYLEKTSHD
jgi:hypothetical protein